MSLFIFVESNPVIKILQRGGMDWRALISIVEAVCFWSVKGSPVATETVQGMLLTKQVLFNSSIACCHLPASLIYAMFLLKPESGKVKKERNTIKRMFNTSPYREKMGRKVRAVRMRGAGTTESVQTS